MYMYRKKESEVTQSCLTLCDPMDYSLPGSSIHGIFQARVLEWASLVAQLVKNPPAMRVDLGSIPGLGRYPGEGKATHSSILAWRIPWTLLGVTKSWT